MMPDKLAPAFADTIIHQRTIQVGYTPNFIVHLVLEDNVDDSYKFYIISKDNPAWYLHSDGIIRLGTRNPNGKWTGYFDNLIQCQEAIHKYRESTNEKDRTTETTSPVLRSDGRGDNGKNSNS